MAEAQLTNLVGVSPGQAGAAPKPQQTPGAMTPPPMGQGADGAGHGSRGERAQPAPAQPGEDLEGTEGLPALSPLQERAMVALLASPTIANAARQSRVGERTIRKWLAHDQNFVEHFRNGRREVLGKAVHELRTEIQSAIATIAEIHRCNNNPPSTRLAAARTVLEFAFRGTEMIDVVEQLRTTQEAVEAAERREKRGGRA